MIELTDVDRFINDIVGDITWTDLEKAINDELIFVHWPSMDDIIWKMTDYLE